MYRITIQRQNKIEDDDFKNAVISVRTSIMSVLYVRLNGWTYATADVSVDKDGNVGDSITIRSLDPLRYPITLSADEIETEIAGCFRDDKMEFFPEFRGFKVEEIPE